MPSSPDSDTAPSPAFLDAFRAQAGSAGTLPFDAFMALALYHPELGYYCAEKTRVGRGAGTDFFTATSAGPLFGELVHAACATLLGDSALAGSTFVEIGAEPAGGVLAGVSHRFRAEHSFRIGETITLSGPCVVFSNELFDARPFRRFRFREGQWRELGVALDGDALRETEVPKRQQPSCLPPSATEGYCLDLPLEATSLAQTLAAQPWTGLFLAFDYGKSWRELAEASPAGTARAYFHHRQSNDLLARPGRQDLTCHVCWDWLADALRQTGFAAPVVETQESFFIRHASEFLSRTVSAEAARLSQRKLALLQLLHQQGQKFQVLWALR